MTAHLSLSRGSYYPPPFCAIRETSLSSSTTVQQEKNENFPLWRVKKDSHHGTLQYCTIVLYFRSKKDCAVRITKDLEF
jgi:hypothetical protein